VKGNIAVNVFSPQLQEKIQGFLTRYETRRTAIIPILHAIQDEHGWISEAQVECLQKDYDLSRVEVREVMTFYTLYHDEAPAKYEILFCDNIVCSMMGARDAIAKIEKRIKEFRDAGKEAPFSVEGVPCLGVCDGAPAMLVNKDRHLRVTAENVDQILAKYQP
jgi:NADH-quinone oxidoreductase subunit E